MRRFLSWMLVFIITLSIIPAYAQNLRNKHIAAFGTHFAAIQQDSTVKAVGKNDYGQCDTSAWRNVVAISIFFSHTLGLKADGTVYAAGDNTNGECEVDGWRDIVMVVAAPECSFGLKKDGTIVWAGILDKQDQNLLESWKDIIWIGYRWRNSLFAIDKYGKAYGVGNDFSLLENVVQVNEVNDVFHFLLADGTIKMLAPFNGYSEVINKNTPKWANVREISSAGSYDMALKWNGTVISDSAISYFSDWTDVVEIDEGFGVRSDGIILTEGDFADPLTPDQLAEISSWKVMVVPDTMPEPAEQMEVP